MDLDYFKMQDNKFKHYPSDDPNCANSGAINKCDTLTIDGVFIQSPSILPCCLLALIAGVYSFKRVRASKYYGSKFYSLVFLLIGIMMTDAGLVDCLLSKAPWTPLHVNLLVLDIGLTSSIGLGFFFCGLIDLKVLKGQLGTFILYFIGMATIFYLYFKSIQTGNSKLTRDLYVYNVGFGCGSWVLVQTYLQFQVLKGKGLIYIAAATLAGGAGFLTLLDFKFDQILCELFTCYFAGRFLWFLVTPICAYLLGDYYLATHSPTNQNGEFVTLRENQNRIVLIPVANIPQIYNNMPVIMQNQLPENSYEMTNYARQQNYNNNF